MQKITPVEALQKAIDLVGGQSAMAEKLTALAKESVSQSRVWNWLKRDGKAPVEFCALIEQIVNAEVTRQMLCTDWRTIWPELSDQDPLPSVNDGEITQGDQ
jgi:DNA-binding transcriptional regulator YdaS (Cro superfamily)